MPARPAAAPIPMPTAAPVERPLVLWSLLVWFDVALAAGMEMPFDAIVPAPAVVKSDG